MQNQLHLKLILVKPLLMQTQQTKAIQSQKIKLLIRSNQQ